LRSLIRGARSSSFKLPASTTSYSLPTDDKIEVTKKATENVIALELANLKPNDEKARRLIKPEMPGKTKYRGNSYLKMRTFCLKQNEERVFRVDRILQMRQA